MGCREDSGVAEQVSSHPGSLRKEGMQLPRLDATRLRTAMVQATLAIIPFEIVSKLYDVQSALRAITRGGSWRLVRGDENA